MFAGVAPLISINNIDTQKHFFMKTEMNLTNLASDSHLEKTHPVNHYKEALLRVSEELGAWMLIGGFVMSIAWVAGIIF